MQLEPEEVVVTKAMQEAKALVSHWKYLAEIAYTGYCTIVERAAAAEVSATTKINLAEIAVNSARSLPVEAMRNAARNTAQDASRAKERAIEAAIHRDEARILFESYYGQYRTAFNHYTTMDGSQLATGAPETQNPDLSTGVADPPFNNKSNFDNAGEAVIDHEDVHGGFLDGPLDDCGNEVKNSSHIPAPTYVAPH